MISGEVECDVLIIGAGMAGSCLARQLRLQQPDLRIVNIDGKTRFDYWVGESTVEAWGDYMIRVLKLGPFLEKNFIQKHGLRLFFDSPEKNLALREMSEFGRTRYSALPAWNLDRALFDRKMSELNRASGIDVRLGAAVLPGDKGIEIDPNEGHRVRTTNGNFRCRWLVDAAGPRSPLARLLDLVPPETRHPSASYWGRFTDFNRLDDLGDRAWRARVNFTRRYRSTNHFQYRDYWIWHIPLSGTVLSLGVEFNRENTPLRMRNGADLERFLRGHRALDEILGPKARLLDFGALTRLARCARKHFSQDRWYLAGMSGLFVDVMGSGTSRIYAETNRLIGELIKTDRSGDAARLRSRLKHFNLHLRSGYERQLRNLSRYDWYGSFDVWPVFFGANVAKYLNSLMPNGASDLRSLLETADTHVGNCRCSFENFSRRELEKGFSTALYRLTEEFVKFLDKTGSYYSGNRGRFFDFGFWELRPGILRKIRLPRNLAAEAREDLKIYRDVARLYAIRMAEIGEIKFDESAFRRAFEPDWNSGQTLAQLARRMGGVARGPA